MMSNKRGTSKRSSRGKGRPTKAKRERDKAKQVEMKQDTKK